jgi:hypothetical protein
MPTDLWREVVKLDVDFGQGTITSDVYGKGLLSCAVQLVDAKDLVRAANLLRKIPPSYLMSGRAMEDMSSSLESTQRAFDMMTKLAQAGIVTPLSADLNVLSRQIGQS